MKRDIEKIQSELEFRKNTEADENEETVANALELLELCAAKNLTVQEATDSLEAAIRILPIITKMQS